MRRRWRLNRRPQISLNFRRVGVDLPELLRIAGGVKQDSLVEIAPEQRTHSRRVPGGQQIGPHVFRADRVGLRRLELPALVVTADGHRKAEPDDEAEQRERRTLHDAEVLAHEFIEVSPSPGDGGADARRERQAEHRDREHHEW